MFWLALRSIKSFFFPGGLLFLTFFLVNQLHFNPGSLPLISKVYPLAVLALGLFLGWRFNRTRLLFSLIVLMVGYCILLYPNFLDTKVIPQTSVVFLATSILLPVNFAVFSFFKERGVFTLHGLSRLFFIIVQPITVAILYHQHPAIVAILLRTSYVSSSFLDIFMFPQLPFFTFAAASFVVLINYIRDQSAISQGFFWATVTLFFAFYSSANNIETFTIYYFTGALILAISVIEAAHGMAFRDQLTGLPGRRALTEALLKLPHQYALAMIDIDHFKKFNDTYGHDVGDQALRMVATRLAGVQGGGKAFRYGGEEFTVLFSGKTANEAHPFLEQLRTTIATTDFIIRSPKRWLGKPSQRNKASSRKIRRTSVTVSIGLSDSSMVRSPARVIKAADKSLYKAKKRGRNRVLCS